MSVMLYNDLLNKLARADVARWFKENFSEKPNSVAVVVCPYPVEGAAQWIVEDDAAAKKVLEKLGTRSRIWTLPTIKEYLACFGEKVETCKEAALLLDREEYSKPQEKEYE